MVWREREGAGAGVGVGVAVGVGVQRCAGDAGVDSTLLIRG